MAFSPSWGMTEVGLPSSPVAFQLSGAMAARDSAMSPETAPDDDDDPHPQEQELVVRSEGLKAILSGIERDESLVLFLDPKFSVEEHVAASVRAGSVAYALENAERAASLISANVREEVIRRQDALLGEVEAVGALEREVTLVAEGVTGLSTATDKLVKALADPYEPMKAAVTKLQNLHDACEVLRKVSLFKTYVAKLRDAEVLGTPSGTSTTTSAEVLLVAADAMQELDEMAHNGDFAVFERIETTRRDVPLVRKATDNIKRRTAESLLDAMKRVSKADVGASLHAFHILGCLDDRVQAESSRLLSVVSAAVHDGFDPRYNPKAVSVKGEKQRDIWSKIDDMTETIAIATTQVSVLHMVLDQRQDLKTLKPLSSFITSIDGSSISQALVEMIGNCIGDQVHVLVQSANRRAGGLSALNALSQNFPRLRARFIALKERIVSAGSTLLSTSDRDSMLDPVFIESALLAGIVEIEETYVLQSLKRLMDPTRKMFEATSLCPGEAEALGLAKLFATELALTRDDTKLSETTARNITEVLNVFATSAETLLSTLHSRLSPPERYPSAERDLCELHNAMHCLQSATRRLAAPGEMEWSADTSKKLHEACTKMNGLNEILLGPLFSEITTAIENTLLGIHEESLDAEREQEYSEYIEVMTSKISHFRKEIASQSLKSRVFASYAQELGRRCLNQMTTQVSLLLSLSDESKGRITADLAQVEYVVASICTVQDVINSYASSRAMRKLLFVNTWEILDDFEKPESNASMLFRSACDDLRPSLILNHMISRAPPTLVHPHRRLGQSLREYCQWLESAPESSICSQIEESLDSHSNAMESSGGTVCEEYTLCKRILPSLVADYESKRRK